MKDAAYLAENLRISQDHNAVLRPRERNVQPPRVVEETNSLVLITPNTTQNNVILFTALESIDTSNFYFFVQVLLKGTVELHVVDNIRALSFIRRNYANLSWNYNRLEKLSNYLLNIRRFSSDYRYISVGFYKKK